MSQANYEIREAFTPGTLVKAAASALPQAGCPAGLPANDTLRPIGRVGIIGADTRGIAIATHLLDADIPVTLFDSREATVQGVALARTGYAEQVRSGQLPSDKRDRRMALLTGAANFHHLKDCDLIFAAVSPDRASAEKLVRRLDELLTKNAVLVTDQAPAGINDLARYTRRPAEVLGMRCSDPADPLACFDLVRGKETSDEAVATVDMLLKTIRGLKD